jgi:hypothetical protein
MMNVLKEILTGEKAQEKKKEEVKLEKKEEKFESTSATTSQEKFEEKAKTEKYEETVFKSSGPITENVVEKPKIIQETVINKQKEVIQPVIVREREQVEINQVTQPYRQTEIKPAIVKERELPAEYREFRQGMSEESKKEYIKESGKFKSTKEFAPVEYQRVEKAPIVHETVHKVVKTEVQPVIYKETIQPEIIKEVKPIYEKIVEAPVIHKETKEIKELKTVRGGQQATAVEGQGLEKKFEKVSISASSTTTQTNSQQS